jgi:hypothetical protein
MMGFLSPFVRGHLGEALCQIGGCFCEAERMGCATVLHARRVKIITGLASAGKRARSEDQEASVAFVRSVFDVEASDCPFEKSVFLPNPHEHRPLDARINGRGVRVWGRFENGMWFAGAPGATLHAMLRPAVALADASERDRLKKRAFIHFPADCDSEKHAIYYSRAVAVLRAAVRGVVFEIFAEDMFSPHVQKICDACAIGDSAGSAFSRAWKQADAMRSMAACGAGGVVSTDWISWWAAFLCCSADAAFAVPATFECAGDHDFMKLPHRTCTIVPAW